MKRLTTIAALLAISSTPVLADLNDERLSCSAHFEARAVWGQAMGSDVGYIDGMARRADLLLRDYETANPISGPQDWGMVTLGVRPAPYHEVVHDKIVEETMVYFADQSPMSGQAPLCAEDAICQTCSDLLRSIMP